MKIKASFDDATVDDLKAADLMAKYEIETIFYWPVMPEIVNEPKGRTSLSEQEQIIIANQFEIGSHTITHPLLTRIPLVQAETEIRVSRGALQQKFNQEINSFCYPRGYANPALQQVVVESGYSNARSTLVGYVHQSENQFFEQTAVHISCDRKEYAGLDWYEYAMKLLDIARVIPDSVFHIFGHSWEIDEHDDWDRFENFLQELTS